MFTDTIPKDHFEESERSSFSLSLSLHGQAGRSLTVGKQAQTEAQRNYKYHGKGGYWRDKVRGSSPSCLGELGKDERAPSV